MTANASLPDEFRTPIARGRVKNGKHLPNTPLGLRMQFSSEDWSRPFVGTSFEGYTVTVSSGCYDTINDDGPCVLHKLTPTGGSTCPPLSLSPHVGRVHIQRFRSDMGVNRWEEHVEACHYYERGPYLRQILGDDGTFSQPLHRYINPIDSDLLLLESVKVRPEWDRFGIAEALALRALRRIGHAASAVVALADFSIDRDDNDEMTHAFLTGMGFQRSHGNVYVMPPRELVRWSEEAQKLLTHLDHQFRKA